MSTCGNWNYKNAMWRTFAKLTQQIFHKRRFSICALQKVPLQTEQIKKKIIFNKTFWDKTNIEIRIKRDYFVENCNESEKKTGHNGIDKDVTDGVDINDDGLKPHWLNIKETFDGKIEPNNIAADNNDLTCVTKKQSGEVKWKCAEYLKISKKSKMMKYIIRLKRKRNFRNKMNAFFVKYSQTILHLLKNNNSLIFEAVLSTNKNILQNFKGKDTKLYYVNSEVMNYIFKDSMIISKKTNDAVAIIKMPGVIKNEKRIKFLLAFDRIRYAHNLGKMLKVAYSMDVDFLFYIHNTVDPFNSKVIEETNGNHLFIPYTFGTYEELKQICIEHNLLPLVAHTDGYAPNDILKENDHKGICLIMCNESIGPHPVLLNFAKPISIPMHEMTNSLNVAAAASILIYILRCQQ